MTLELGIFHKIFVEEYAEIFTAVDGVLCSINDESDYKEVISLLIKYFKSIRVSSTTIGYKSVSSLFLEIEEYFQYKNDVCGKINVSEINALKKILIDLDSVLNNKSENEIQDYEKKIKKIQNYFTKKIKVHFENSIGNQVEVFHDEGGISTKDNYILEKDDSEFLIMIRSKTDSFKKDNSVCKVILDIRKDKNLEIKNFSIKNDELPSLSEFDPYICHLTWTFNICGIKSRDYIKEKIEKYDCLEISSTKVLSKCIDKENTKELEDKVNSKGIDQYIPFEGISSLKITMEEWLKKVIEAKNLFIDSEININNEFLDKINFQLNELSKDIQKKINTISTVDISQCGKDVFQNIKLNQNIELVYHFDDMHIDPKAWHSVYKSTIGVIKLISEGDNDNSQNINLDHKKTICIRFIDEGLDLCVEIFDKHSYVDENTDILKKAKKMIGSWNDENALIKLDLINRKGKSKIVLRFHLTYKYTDCQFFDLAGGEYIVPIRDIKETLIIERSHLGLIDQSKKIMMFEDRNIPYCYLGELFGDQSKEKDYMGSVLVIVEKNENMAGILFDKIMCQKQSFIKSLEMNYKKIKYHLGAVIDENESVVPVIDVNEILTEIS